MVFIRCECIYHCKRFFFQQSDFNLKLKGLKSNLLLATTSSTRPQYILLILAKKKIPLIVLNHHPEIK